MKIIIIIFSFLMEAHTRTPSFRYVTKNTVKYYIYDTKTAKSYCVYQVEQIISK